MDAVVARWNDERLDERPRRAATARCGHHRSTKSTSVRGAGARPTATLLSYRRTHRGVDSLRCRYGIYARRADAGDRISIRRLVGVSTVGLFAPTSRFGTPEDFRASSMPPTRLGIGVILDWVPGHFPNDPHGLAFFDGTHLYEYADPRQGLPSRLEHADLQLRPARSCQLSSRQRAVLDRGVSPRRIRVDAVASMLYLDYSRKEGEWVPNEFGGNENLEAVAFLRRFNQLSYHHSTRIVTIAEESTPWPMVTCRRIRRRPRLRIQMEHGLDARHAAVRRARSRPPPLPSKGDHVRLGLRV